MVVGCQPYAPAAFTPRKYFWYSFLLEAESIPGPYCNRKDFMSMKNSLTPAGIELYTFRFVVQRLNPLNAELNPTCRLQALLGARHILHVSRIRVKHCTTAVPSRTYLGTEISSFYTNIELIISNKMELTIVIYIHKTV
jgi:hypothetical protein